jgi:hypothetical protein
MRFEGKTVDAEVPFLSADFWIEGAEIKGTVAEITTNDTGDVYQLEVFPPVKIGVAEYDVVQLGGMKGLGMALKAAGVSALRVDDKLTLRAEGRKKSKSKDFADRVNFVLTLDRD